MFQKIESRGALVLSNKIRQQCSEVFTHALITGRCDSNPCFGLEKVMLKANIKHFPHLLEKDLPPFIYSLSCYAEHSPIVGRAAKLLMITGVRTGELRLAQWCEIDFDKAIWEIPAERMKKRKPHIVSLSSQAIKILEYIYKYNRPYKFIFVGRNDKDKPISDASILRAIERMGYKNKVTGHGFRQIMSTILHEHGFNTAHVELHLPMWTRTALGGHIIMLNI